MIRPVGNGKFELVCDTCGYTVTGFDNFMEAVDYKKENEWKSIKTPDGWEDACDNCKEGHA